MTDRQTDEQTFVIVESLSRLKKKQKTRTNWDQLNKTNTYGQNWPQTLVLNKHGAALFLKF